VFYLVMGSVRLKGEPTGRLIERFNVVERAAHWAMAIAFGALAITGFIILWGKHLVLPWLGYTGFAWLSVAAKTLHNFVGPVFLASLLLSFLLFVKDNLLRALDFRWIARFGNMYGKGEEIPSGRFNGLEKLWFWVGLVFLGTVVGVSGLILDFPDWDWSRQVMQQANMVHAVAAIAFIAASFGHIYIGTIGMEGAYRAMREGSVDEAWAREHHLLWYRQAKRLPPN
jgi:formate dehydrogenase subunit gamma